MSEPSSGTFEVEDFDAELRGEPNRGVGTTLLLENERVRIWEIRLEPGERSPFHWHTTTYFFVCVDPGRARSRFPNGMFVDLDYDAGTTWFSDHSEDSPEIHDLENVGPSTIRFTTVELLVG